MVHVLIPLAPLTIEHNLVSTSGELDILTHLGLHLGYILV